MAFIEKLKDGISKCKMLDHNTTMHGVRPYDEYTQPVLDETQEKYLAMVALAQLVDGLGFQTEMMKVKNTSDDRYKYNFPQSKTDDHRLPNRMGLSCTFGDGTDDSSMLYCAAISHTFGDNDEELFGLLLRNWYHRGFGVMANDKYASFGLGYTIANTMFNSLPKGHIYTTIGHEKPTDTERSSNGNGPLLVFGGALFKKGGVEEKADAARKQSKVLNRGDLSMNASELLTRIAYSLIHSKNDIRTVIDIEVERFETYIDCDTNHDVMSYEKHDELRIKKGLCPEFENCFDHVDGKRRLKKFGPDELYDSITNRPLYGNETVKGNLCYGGSFMGDCLPYVLSMVYEYADDPMECLHEVIGRGGDSDSTGMVVAQLFGAYYGFEKTPMYWKEVFDNYKDGSISCFYRNAIKNL